MNEFVLFFSVLFWCQMSCPIGWGVVCHEQHWVRSISVTKSLFSLFFFLIFEQRVCLWELRSGSPLIIQSRGGKTGSPSLLLVERPQEEKRWWGRSSLHNKRSPPNTHEKQIKKRNHRTDTKGFIRHTDTISDYGLQTPYKKLEKKNKQTHKQTKRSKEKCVGIRKSIICDKKWFTYRWYNKHENDIQGNRYGTKAFWSPANFSLIFSYFFLFSSRREILFSFIQTGFVFSPFNALFVCVTLFRFFFGSLPSSLL